MNVKTLEEIDFFRIREVVADYCITTEGKNNFLQKLPISDSEQIDFLKTDYRPLFLNRMIKLNNELSCPRCKNTMQPSEETRKVEIKHSRHKITIRAEVLDITELFSLPCLTGGSVTIEFPLYEVACFNFTI